MNQIIDGKREGYWEIKYLTGVWHKGNYINGKRNGYWEFYFTGRQLDIISKGSYIDDKQDGYWAYYYDDGDLKEQEIYL